MTSLDIDTLSDIYSLGVLLYELLAGATPFDAQELMSLGIDAMRKTIREKEPVRPSTRLATLQRDELTTAAKRRAIEAPRLIHLLKGDLDWIVMKCLEKDRTRRYDTANGLAADLMRHLENEPVVARPASAAYRFQKAFRRNKLAFGAAGAVVAALLLGIVISAWQASRANREAARALRAEAVAKERLAEVGKESDAKELASQDAEAVSTFLTDVFQSPDPTEEGRTITVAEALDKAATNLESDPAVPPARRAKLEATLGLTYNGLGLYGEAAALQEKVRDYDVATFGLENTNTLFAMGELAVYYDKVGRRDDALNLQDEALRLRLKMNGTEDPALTAMSRLALSYHQAGRQDDALKLWEELLTLNLKRDPNSRESAYAYGQLGFTLNDLGRFDEAIKDWQVAVKIAPTTETNTLYWLGDSLVNHELYAEALPVLRATRKFYPDGDRGRETTRRLALAEAMLGTGNAGDGTPDRAPSAKSLTAWVNALGQEVATNSAVLEESLHLAIVYLWLGQTNDYQALCRNLLEQVANSKDSIVLDKAAKACLIQAYTDPDLLKLAVTSGRQALALLDHQRHLPTLVPDHRRFGEYPRRKARRS